MEYTRRLVASLALVLVACDELEQRSMQVPLLHPVRVASADLRESEDVEIDLTEGTLAAALAVTTSDPSALPVLITQLARPDGSLVFRLPAEGTPLTTSHALPAPARTSPIGAVATLLLSGSDRTDLLPPGSYTARLAAATDRLEAHVVRRLGAAPGAALLDLTLVFASDAGLRSDDVANWVPAFERTFELLGAAGLARGHVEIRDDVTADFGSIDVTVRDPSSTWFGVVSTASELATARSLPVVFVRSLDAGANVGTVLGASSNVPAVPGAPSAILVSVTAHALIAPTLDQEELAHTLAHEILHALGLFHTSEADGAIHDLVSDTPECGADADRNRDGVLTSRECSGRGGDNLMFWTGQPRATLTAGQSIVVRRAPYVRPKE